MSQFLIAGLHLQSAVNVLRYKMGVEKFSTSREVLYTQAFGCE